jgi:hypothetical protein
MIAAIEASTKLGCTYSFDTTPVDSSIPIGTVEFCQEAFGPHRLDFYPQFLQPWLKREVTLTHAGQLYRQMFVKDATAWKSFYVSEVKPSGYILPSGSWWVSEPIQFVNEWRYYVADGDVVTTGWYDGNDETKEAPTLDIEWPKGFSGAVDFGELESGEVALVECHAPFACGWYGEDHSDYLLWLAVAWEDKGWWR